MDDDMIPEWLKLVEAGQLEMNCGEVEQYGRYRYLIDFWGRMDWLLCTSHLALLVSWVKGRKVMGMFCVLAFGLAFGLLAVD